MKHVTRGRAVHPRVWRAKISLPVSSVSAMLADETRLCLAKVRLASRIIRTNFRGSGTTASTAMPRAAKLMANCNFQWARASSWFSPSQLQFEFQSRCSRAIVLHRHNSTCSIIVRTHLFATSCINGNSIIRTIIDTMKITFRLDSVQTLYMSNVCRGRVKLRNRFWNIFFLTN